MWQSAKQHSNLTAVIENQDIKCPMTYFEWNASKPREEHAVFCT